MLLPFRSSLSLPVQGLRQWTVPSSMLDDVAFRTSQKDHSGVTAAAWSGRRRHDPAVDELPDALRQGLLSRLARDLPTSNHRAGGRPDLRQ